VPPGYHGAYLRIDLSTGAARRVEIPREVLARHIGGVGLGTWICANEGGAVHDPLSPPAPLILCLSPLVGTPLTTSAKFAVVARSPLTGYLCDAISSSHFAIAAKRAGYDAYAIVGRAPALSRLVVEDGRVTVREEGGLRGQPASACGLEGFKTAAIGPAGERLVRYAMISNDGRHAGRGGLGAIMGAKNLKAFSVRGTQHVEVADPRGVVAEARRLSDLSFGPATAKYRELGTIANVLAFNRLNTLPARNFRDSSFEGAAEVSAEALHAMNRVGRESCAACTIGCEHIFRAPGGEPVRLEYESVFALGPLLGISDRDAMIEAARLCDLYGLDTISLGGTLACWMEAGRMPFGDARAVLDMIGRIARREGDGDLLAEGSRRVASHLGRPDLAMHVKGLEIPGYDPRALPAMALGFAVGTRGADHNRSSAYELDFSTEKFDVAKVVEHENRAAAMDSLILCKFLRGVFKDFAREGADLLRLVTGFDVDLLEAGARICDLRKQFNVACGWRREEDTLPERLLSGKLTRAKLDAMIEGYYRARGWSAGGVPAMVP
jgi:aldehyde:ferredoxin oxidoreductase